MALVAVRTVAESTPPKRLQPIAIPGAGWPDASDPPWVRCTLKVAERAPIAGFRGDRHCRAEINRFSEGNPVHCGGSGATVARQTRAPNMNRAAWARALQRPYAVGGKSATVAALGVSPYAMNPMAIK